MNKIFYLFAVLICTASIFAIVPGQHFIESNKSILSGQLDPTFNLTGKLQTPMGFANDIVSATAVQTDGKIVCAGYSYNADGNYDFSILRLNSDGSLDKSFNSNGKILLNLGSGTDWATGLAIQPNGKILVGGTSFTGLDDDFAIVRINADGSLDNTFGIGGTVFTNILKEDRIGSLALQPDGKIIAAGFSYNPTGDAMIVARYNSNGSLDNTFGLSGLTIEPVNIWSFFAESIKIQNDGKIVIGGYALNELVNGYSEFMVSRYNIDGNLDTTFNSTGTVRTRIGNDFSRANSLAIQPDGKILLGGSSSNLHFVSDFTIVRYNTNGLLDPTFGTNGVVITALTPETELGADLLIQPDGKIILTGNTFTDAANLQNFSILRYKGDGNLDADFGNNGLVNVDFGGSESAASADLQPDGKLVVAGWSTNSTQRILSLMRLLGDSPIPAKAAISGRIQGNTNIANSFRSLIIKNLQTNESRLVPVNAFGYFRATELPTNNYYSITVKTKRGVQEFPEYSYRLLGNLDGLILR